ncbi:MAG: ATP-binding protein [Muribaculaceae bacterium]|nr:ATP-binding protein [Muribaculaceae bacterium]
MKFFDRKREIEILRDIREKSQESARFTVVTGRRRIGKTSLILTAYENTPLLYFFVGRKAENILCEEYRMEVEKILQIKMGGTPSGFSELFEYLMDLAKERNFTLFIDEFQNFERINPSVFSDIQKIWDLNHNESKINLIVCGSVYTMMNKIFKDKKEPLYNRQNSFIKISPFPPSVVKEILKYYSPQSSNEDLLALYSFTGGVAKYIELLMQDNAFTLDKMIDNVISDQSVFIGEGRALLIEEFGKEYDTYFSILSAIASGQTRRGEIETAVGKPIGGYLTRLENDYGIIKGEIPLGSKPLSRNNIYVISDNFLTFWFRFIFKYEYILEIGGYEQLKSIIKRDYTTFSGKMLERYFFERAVESKKYTRIGRWWDSKGKNEIDLICGNELEKTLAFYEIKRNKKNASVGILKDKAEKMIAGIPALKNNNEIYLLLDIGDM